MNRTTRFALLAALAFPAAAAAQPYTSSRDAQPPFSDATYYNGHYYSTACRAWDDDSDGVNNCHDFCPETSEGVDVGIRGCPMPAMLNIDAVHFAFNSSRISPRLAVELNGAILSLFEFPTMPVHIAGHTDSVGSQRYNQRLSERRAWAVRNYITQRGVDPARVSVAGYGERAPVASNATGWGRAENRRSEFVFPDVHPRNYHRDASVADPANDAPASIEAGGATVEHGVMSP